MIVSYMAMVSTLSVVLVKKTMVLVEQLAYTNNFRLLPFACKQKRLKFKLGKIWAIFQVRMVSSRENFEQRNTVRPNVRRKQVHFRL